MKFKGLKIGLVLSSVAALLLLLSACNSEHVDAAEAPPPTTFVSDVNVSLFSVDHPEQYPLAAATALSAAPKLVVTGTVNPDITRNVPVISLASGRVVAIHARLGDTVKKGQLLLSIRSDDVAIAFSDYRKAVADETLARTQLERSKGLYERGAISMNDLQVAQDTEYKAKVDVETMAEHLRLLGNDPDKPDGVVEVHAPIAGVVTDQQVTNAAGVQALGSNPFTISDLSHVWVVCDVYENDLSDVAVGETAEVRLNAYPDKVVTGRISNIGAVLDPNLRTAKVRVEVANPGMMRMGMFATATLTRRKKETHTVVPASAVLRIHDRDWVYVPAPDKKFRRLEVVSGDDMPNNMVEVKSGLAPGQQVVANALMLEHAIEQ
jgi:cobalt-zinc-cadmium efflux system membrane fusion protein